MRYLIAVLLLATAPLFAADTYTSGYNLRLPDLDLEDEVTPWGEKYNTNFTLVDAAIKAVAISTGTLAVSSGTLAVDIAALQVSTGILQADLATEVSDRQAGDAALGVSTGTNYTAINSTAIALTAETADRVAGDAAIAVSTTALVKKGGDTMTGNLTLYSDATSTGNIIMNGNYYHYIQMNQQNAAASTYLLGEIQFLQIGTGKHRIMSYGDTHATYPKEMQIGADSTSSGANVRITGAATMAPDLFVSSWTSVGISTSNPNSIYKLHVNGDMWANNYYGTGSGLTGVATSAQLTSTAAALTAEIADRIAGDLAVGVDTGTLRADYVTLAASTGPLTSYANWNTAYGWGNHALGGYANLVAVGASTASLRSDLTALALSTSPLSNYATWNTVASSATYWNAKQAAGNYITSLTGGVTASGPGASAATVVTNANLTGPITSVGNATTIVGPVPASAVDLSTVTTAIGLRVLKAGDTMTGNLDLNGYLLQNVGSIVSGAYNPASSIEALNLYSGNILRMSIASGGNTSIYSSITSTGQFTTSSSMTATGGFVGNLIGNLIGNADTATSVPQAGVNLSTVTANHVLKSGDTMTGPLTLTGAGSYVTTASSMSAASAVIGGNTFNGNFTSTGIISGNGSGLTGQANSLRVSTATYLATAPGACSAGQFISALTADGTKTCATPAGGGDVVLAATQTFTGVNTFNNKIEIAKTYTESISSQTITGAWNISFSSSTFYWVALNASTTFTFSNVAPNSNITFMIEQSSNTKLITWPAYVDWGSAGAVVLSTTTRKMDMVNILCLSATKCYGKGTKDGYTAP